MSAMHFDPIEAKILSRLSGYAVGLYYLPDLFHGGRRPHLNERQVIATNDARWAYTSFTRLVLLEHAISSRHPRLPDQSHVPELREYPCARCMHLSNDMAPAFNGVFTIKSRRVSIMPCAPMRNESAFGNDQTDSSLCATAIISRNILARHTVRRHRPGHRCHGHPILDGQTANSGLLKEKIETACGCVELCVGCGQK